MNFRIQTSNDRIIHILSTKPTIDGDPVDNQLALWVKIIH